MGGRPPGGHRGGRVHAVPEAGKDPLYQSSATFTVATGDEDSGSYSFYYDQTMADQLSKTFPYVLESSYFRSMLLDRLGTDELNGTVSAETITDSNVVTMRAESLDPQDAADILSAALEIYPETARFVLGRSSSTCWMRWKCRRPRLTR